MNGFPWYLSVKNPTASNEIICLIPGSGRAPRKGNNDTSVFLPLEILCTVEPSRLQSMGSKRVRHDLAMKQEENLQYGDSCVG